MKNSKKLKLIAGLGNPEEKYENTRHNIGREIVLKLINNLGLKLLPDAKIKNCLITIINKKTTAIIPQIFMNKSGKIIGEYSKKNKIKPAEILVIHDDIDIPFGKFKLSYAKNSAGHKGVESVIKTLKTNEFWRLRIGIGSEVKKIDALKLVLKKWNKEEVKILTKIIKKSIEIINELLKNLPR